MNAPWNTAPGGQGRSVVLRGECVRVLTLNVDVDERSADVHPAGGPDAHESITSAGIDHLTVVRTGQLTQTQGE
jgi:hypothetical protein